METLRQTSETVVQHYSTRTVTEKQVVMSVRRWILAFTYVMIAILLFINTLSFVQNVPKHTNISYLRSQPTHTRTPHQSKVIILTYMRSGSSLTGDIIQQHPRVFYVFEPLRTIGRQFEGLDKPNVIYFADNTSVVASWSGEGKPPLYIRTVQTVFSCDFQNLDNGTLKQDHMKQSKTTSDASVCYGSKRTNMSDWEHLLQCFEPVKSTCRSSDLIVVKSIRLSMAQAEVIMSSDPSVKVIHLVRDPRGTLISREPFQKFDPAFASSQASTLCGDILRNIQISKSISSTFPNRILTVRYEDIAESPIEASRQMYEFLKLDMRPEIENYIWNITYGGKKDGCRFCTVRKNATETSNAWRKFQNYSTIVDIERSCLPLLNSLGYHVFQSKQELRNLSVFSKYSIYDSELMKVVIGKVEESKDT